MRLTREKFILYISGLLILTLGISLAIQSRLGTSPFDALLVGLYRTVGLTVGSWEIIVGAVMVLCNAIALRRRPEYLALLTSFITGLGIDFWLFVVRDWLVPETMIGQFICLGAGLLLSGLGIATYLQANFAPIPMDGSMLVVHELTGLNVAISRILLNIVLVTFAFFFHGPIGIGTIIIALSSGPIINFLMPYIAKLEKGMTKQKQCLTSSG
ncbi:YitT family protein [Bacillus tianshenii]|nr:YitT family protein [Bacillus tianshenii]